MRFGRPNGRHDRCSSVSIAARASATAALSSSWHLRRSLALPDRGLQRLGAFGDAKRADGARRTLQRVRQRARLGRQRRELRRSGWSAWLANMPSTCALERGIAERHARQMREIDRTSHRGRAAEMASIRSVVREAACWCGWRPAFPVADSAGPTSQTQRWLTERLTYPPRSSPCFRPRVAAIYRFPQEISCTFNTLTGLLLTMIKIVLIAAISFVSLNQ